MEIQPSRSAPEVEVDQDPEGSIDTDDGQAAAGNDPETQENPNDNPTGDEPQSAGEDDAPLSPAQLKALHKMRQKDREDIQELKTLMKEKEARDQELAAKIVGDVIRDPSKLGSYLDEYGLRGKPQEPEEDEVPPDIENMSVQELYKTLAKKAEEVAAKKAASVARSETTYVNSERDVKSSVNKAWTDLMDQDGELRSNVTFQRTVAAMANDLLKEKQAKKEYRVGSETEILKDAYKEVMKLRGKPEPKKAAPVTEEPTPSVNKTVPKRRGNTDADILTRIQRRLSELDSKYKD